MPDETKTKTPRQRALDILIKASLMVASRRLESAELLAVADLLAESVPVETLTAMQEKINVLATKHAERVKEGLTPVAKIDLEKPNENRS